MGSLKIINCSICLESIKKNIHFLPCIHGFHRKCISKWVNKKHICPVCKIPTYIYTLEQLDEYNTNKKIIELKNNTVTLAHNIINPDDDDAEPLLDLCINICRNFLRIYTLITDRY